MAKKLSMKKVNEHVKLKNESFPIEFDDETVVKLRPFFNPDEIEQCVEMIGQSLNYMTENEIELTDRHFWHFVNYTIIKVFTDISYSDNLKTDIQFFITFIKSDYYEEIMSFMQETELARVYEKLFETLANYEKVQRQMEKAREDIQAMPIENEELRNRIQPKQIPEV